MANSPVPNRRNREPLRNNKYKQMKKSMIVLCLAIIIFNSSCSHRNDSEVAEKELKSVFNKMWDNVTLLNADAYFKTDVSDDFYTINADGIVQNKKEILADKKRLEMLELLDFKFYDQKIKAFGSVGIINGRIQAFSEGTYVGEVFYTAIFVKYGDAWKYENWQGTWSKDSPRPPSFISKD